MKLKLLFKFSVAVFISRPKRTYHEVSEQHIWKYLKPQILRVVPSVGFLISLTFLIHAIIRFGGLWNQLAIVISMVLIWPLPWLLYSKKGRTNIGFKTPSLKWILFGLISGFSMIGILALLSWFIFGYSDQNWLIQHAIRLNEGMSQAPVGSSIWMLFGLVTLPSIIFSPFAEEFLYRGFIQTYLTQQFSAKLALNVQAILFALLHLAHYGLVPFEPLLILIFIPSMYATALLFGWLVVKSNSIWTAVISHAAFNFGMNGMVFLFYQNILSV